MVSVPSGVRVSPNAVRVLEGILRAAGLSSATITSGRRTPADQARIMYELIERHGVPYALELYGPSGDEVIRQYEAGKAAKRSATDVQALMQACIEQLGCTRVSNHCSDTKDVIDVAPSSIADAAAFRRALDAALRAGTISKLIPPPKDPAFHIEIAIPPTDAAFEREAEGEFRLASLPGPVRDAVAIGALVWPLAVQRAIEAGLRDPDRLADLVFFMHHPERVIGGVGRALDPAEPQFAKLSAEWKAFRTMVVPMLAPKPAPPPGGSGAAPDCRSKAARFPAAAPSDLVAMKGLGGRTIRLHRRAASALQQLIDAARAQGVAAPLLLPTSGYRPIAVQQQTWERALRRYGSEHAARKWVCKPSPYCPHLSGLAVDLWLGSGTSSANVAQQRATPVYRWLVSNANRFRFRNYCPEPWHWEYQI